MAKFVSSNEVLLAANPVLRQEVEARGIDVSDIDVIDITFCNLLRDVPQVQRASIRLIDGQEIELDPELFSQQKG